jgi:hypothetical protein
VVGLDDVDDGLHERRGRKELAVVLRSLHRELHQEVFVDASEYVATGGAERLAIKHAQQIFEQVVFELVIVLRKLPLERLEVALDGVHRLDDGRAQVRPLGQLKQFVVPGFLRQQQSAAFEEVAFDQRPLGHLAGGLISGDLRRSVVIAVGGMAQKDDAEYRHAVFGRGQLRVGAEVVRCSPEIGFELLDIVQGVVLHAAKAECRRCVAVLSRLLAWRRRHRPRGAAQELIQIGPAE